MKLRADIYRRYASVFSCAFFAKLLQTSDLTYIRKSYSRDISPRHMETCLDFIIYMYSQLCKNYRCEYIYKNALVNYALENHKKSDSAVILNEFKVGSSVADIAIFNGESIAYEIKTELDSEQRIATQLSDYKKLFDKVYVVTHEDIVEKYEKFDSDIGLLMLSGKGKNLKLDCVRDAKKTHILDVDILMKTLHTAEYKNLVIKHMGQLPNVSAFDMYDECLFLMKQIPIKELKASVLTEIKKRKRDISICTRFKKELRHIGAGLNLDIVSYNNLVTMLEGEL